jgi:two-component system sensor histidine kinase KdpD
VARGFVEAIGGGVELDDTPGGGLTVLIDLPIDRDAAGPPDALADG